MAPALFKNKEVIRTATYKQVEYFKGLMRDLGEPMNAWKVKVFSELPVDSASEKLTELEKRRFGGESSDSRTKYEDTVAGQE